MVLSQPVVTRSLCRAGCEDEVMDLGLALNKMNVILCDQIQRGLGPSLLTKDFHVLLGSAYG